METHFLKIHTSVPKWGVCVLKLTGGYNHRRKRKKGEVGILIANLFFIFFLVERKKLKGLKFNTRKGFGDEKHYYCFRQRKKKRVQYFQMQRKLNFAIVSVYFDCLQIVKLLDELFAQSRQAHFIFGLLFFKSKKWLLFLYHDPNVIAVTIKKGDKYYEVVDEYKREE